MIKFNNRRVHNTLQLLKQHNIDKHFKALTWLLLNHIEPKLLCNSTKNKQKTEACFNNSFCVGWRSLMKAKINMEQHKYLSPKNKTTILTNKKNLKTIDVS